MGALLSAVPSEPLVHLLACARCRRRLSGLVVDLGAPEGGSTPAIWSRLARLRQGRARESCSGRSSLPRPERTEGKPRRTAATSTSCRLVPDQRASAIGRIQTL